MSQRNGSIVGALFAAVILTTTAASAEGGALRLTGYRVLAVPQIVEDGRDRLITERLHWQLRAVYVTPRGEELLVRVAPPHHGGAGFHDQIVSLDRPWQRGDVRHQSPLFRSREHAVAHFRRVKGGADPAMVEHVGPRRPPVVQRPMVPPPPGCREILIEKGYSPQLLDRCRGVDERCAIALLNAGHHPQHLGQCRDVEPGCAKQLLRKGHHPQHLTQCRGDLAPRCARTLLQLGHHPQHLQHCREVDDGCAEALLRQGHHPTHLSQCRR